jgi:hypothetical protein
MRAETRQNEPAKVRNETRIIPGRGGDWRCLAVSDSILILRCPYCTTGDDSKELRAYKDGRFVCDACGHTVRPGEPTYRCTCRNCLRWKHEDGA